MGKKMVLSVLAIYLLLNGCKHTNDLGKFVKATSPIEAPQELVNSGKFTYGYMKVPEFHNHPKGKSIELAVGFFKCQSDTATHEPLVLVTGGPGMSDIAGFLPLFFGEMGKLFLNNRDVVIIELRGLKYSKPNLFCPELDNLQMYLLDKNLTPEETVALYMDTLKVAYNRFGRQGINLSAFNNFEIASDIVYVMEQLGYKKFSIFGVSFGTLVAQHVLLNHSDHLVSIVLNAIADLNHGFANFHTNSIKTLDAIFEKCKSDEQLNTAYPDLKNRFLSLIAKLNENPDTLMIKNPSDGKMYKVLMNGNRLSVWIFAQMYYNTQIPLTLHKILTGDYNEIIQNPGIVFPLQDFSNGLSLSIILAEYSNFKEENIPLNNEYASYIKGCGTMFFTPYFLNQAKKVWTVTDLGSVEKKIVSDVPTLMLCGDLDHVCPPSDAIELSKNLKNSYVYVFPGVAHSPIEVGMCGLLMMKEFIDNPSKAPNNDCMKDFRTEFVLPK